MTVELYWLILTSLMTALFWLPYVLDRMMVRGLMGALANPSASDKPQSDWAQRSIRAHSNAVENLVVFAPLAIATHVLGAGSALTATMCMAYFVARLTHFVVYTAGIPIIKTPAFAVGFAAQAVLALNLLGML
ncbi:MAG: MAPEG family protein [Kordiimonadaceae bacterium]|nr:MAPEG family protein [Kordiimonadaceae bacterium]MBT6037593.1 MAPEG family protein [Kordiimonadaceae bacterium]MBT6329593.1 MAPEG family protein [Kordiimonadaceae bacterium]MBT7583460.1 MAPEG family protein [Kordiimonadaceae bacterium]